MRKCVTLLLILVFLVASTIATALPVKAEPTTIVVPDDFQTIQEAIDNASAGDTVFVRKGTYYVQGYRPINIEKTISLIGENSQTTIINERPYRYAEAMVLVEADDVTISGFTFIGISSLQGILLWNTASNCKIIDNNITNYFSGVQIGSSNSNFVLCNNITGNNNGITLTSTENTVISGNNILENHDCGISLTNCLNVTIKENNISNIGVNSSDSYGSNAGGLSFWFGNNDNHVYQNNITCNQFGITFSQNDNNLSKIFNNNIISNDVGIYLRSGSTGVNNRVYYNNFIDNTESLIVKTNATSVVSWDNGVVGNYWSDYDGQGEYVIGENNIDRYPLIQQIDISTTAPELSAIIVVITIIIVVFVGVGLLVYFKKRKH